MHKETSDIMSKKIISTAHDTSMLEVYKLMYERKIRHLPVVNTTGHIIGILSDRDVQRAMKVEHRGSAFKEGAVEFDINAKAQDFMSFPIKSVAATSSVREVALMMLNEKVSAYIVIDENSSPKGIVTTDDMLKLLISLLDKDPTRLKLTACGMYSDFVSGNYN